MRGYATFFKRTEFIYGFLGIVFFLNFEVCPLLASFAPETLLKLQIINTLYGGTSVLEVPVLAPRVAQKLVIRARTCLEGEVDHKKLKIAFLEIWKEVPVITRKRDLLMKKAEQGLKLIFSSWIIQGAPVALPGYCIELVSCRLSSKEDLKK